MVVPNIAAQIGFANSIAKPKKTPTPNSPISEIPIELWRKIYEECHNTQERIDAIKQYMIVKESFGLLHPFEKEELMLLLNEEEMIRDREYYEQQGRNQIFIL